MDQFEGEQSGSKASIAPERTQSDILSQRIFRVELGRISLLPATKS